jgi:hypothetical protein
MTQRLLPLVRGAPSDLGRNGRDGPISLRVRQSVTQEFNYKNV